MSRHDAGGDHGLTIDELARRAGSTTRNIRNYQSLGILPPPLMRGRVGYYDEGHLARLRLIAHLQQRGFSLGGIAELLRAWESGRSLGDVLGFEEALTAPWSDEEPERIGLEELARLFPEALEEPSLATRAIELGLMVPEEDAFVLPSPSLVRAGAEMVDVGIPLAATQDEVQALHQDMSRIAQRFVRLFEDYVWQPFADAGMPAERLPDVTAALLRLRPLAEVAVKATLARAMQEAVAASTAGQVAGVPPQPSPARAVGQ